MICEYVDVQYKIVISNQGKDITVIIQYYPKVVFILDILYIVYLQEPDF
jgi:uncharacterized membrane protein YcjF (UPF0283 family)